MSPPDFYRLYERRAVVKKTRLIGKFNYHKVKTCELGGNRIVVDICRFIVRDMAIYPSMTSNKLVGHMYRDSIGLWQWKLEPSPIFFTKLKLML